MVTKVRCLLTDRVSCRRSRGAGSNGSDFIDIQQISRREFHRAMCFGAQGIEHGSSLLNQMKVDHREGFSRGKGAE